MGDLSPEHNLQRAVIGFLLEPAALPEAEACVAAEEQWLSEMSKAGYLGTIARIKQAVSR